MLLLRSKYQECNNPLANKFRNLPLQAKDRTSANYAVALNVSGTSRSRLCSDGPRVHLSGPAYMPSCIRPEVRLPFYQHVLCSTGTPEQL